MSEKTYTTGEIAKLCNVTTRTVQYYDKEEIIQPSQISEGGRRIYSEKDLQHFRLVCLYKNLGLSLKEIKSILHSENEYKIILDLLTQQQNKLDEQIQEMTELKKKISIILEDISLNNAISISNDNDLSNLIAKKEHHKKIDKMTYLLLCFYIVIIFLSCILGSMLDGIYVYGILGINILILLLLIYFHSSQNAYVCPHCKKKFTITFFQDMFSFNNGKKGKYLKCPYCHHKNLIAETYRDN